MKPFLPAKRLQSVTEYYFSKKLKEIDAMRKSGLDVINLGIGSPDLPPSESVKQTVATNVMLDTTHAYQSYIGIPQLRKAFADWYLKHYRVTLNPDSEILPLMGSKEGIMHICMAFLNEGDEVLVPNPGYPTYSAAVNLVGGKVVYYDLKPETNWEPDFDALSKLDLSKVKLMWVNYPNMPTGKDATPVLYQKLVQFSAEHGIVLVNDNPYSFVLNPYPKSILEIAGTDGLVMELNSLSKSHNMAGWRVGMLAGRKDLVQYVLQVKSNMDSGMFLPLQLAAAEALTLTSEWYKKQDVIYLERRKRASAIMDMLQCKYDQDQTGMFLWGRIPDHYSSAESITDDILQKAHVFITPGSIFGSNGVRYIRISLCTRVEVFDKAIQRLEKMLAVA